MFIPGFLISVLTFPGIIVHEFAHRLFADWSGVPVYQVCYFRFGSPAGYVVHAPARDLRGAFLISVGPLIVNTILCAVLTFGPVVRMGILEIDEMSWVQVLLLWIGISIGMHAFPSNVDMQSLVSAVKSAERGGLLLLSARFFAGLMWVANILRFFWFDAFYAALVSLALPWILGLR
jgi:hypothetical protein